MTIFEIISLKKLLIYNMLIYNLPKSPFTKGDCLTAASSHMAHLKNEDESG
jgi:hypothetical protein